MQRHAEQASTRAGVKHSGGESTLELYAAARLEVTVVLPCSGAQGHSVALFLREAGCPGREMRGPGRTPASTLRQSGWAAGRPARDQLTLSSTVRGKSSSGIGTPGTAVGGGHRAHSSKGMDS